MSGGGAYTILGGLSGGVINRPITRRSKPDPKKFVETKSIEIQVTPEKLENDDNEGGNMLGRRTRGKQKEKKKR